VDILLPDTSLLLGLVVLLGVPGADRDAVVADASAAASMLVRAGCRVRSTAVPADIVTGLRVLRGIGGEDFVRRCYVRDSAGGPASGVRVASIGPC